ncbi:hypothetical protein ACHQM5_008129 [Ranunculus cassubicifolius]
MAESLVKFSKQRLQSLIRQESPILSGLDDQLQGLISILDEVIGFYDSIERMTEKYHKFETQWSLKLRVLVYSMEDCIDQFLIQMENPTVSGRNSLIDPCKTELEELKQGLLDIVNSMSVDLKGKAVNDESQVEKENTSEAGETEASSSPAPAPGKCYYIDLPYYLRSCLLYCGIFPENYAIPKERLVRMLVAEGLVQEKPGELAEDIARENIQALVGHRLLHVVDGTTLKVSNQILELMVGMLAQDSFIVPCTSSNTIVPPTTRRISIHSDAQNIPSDSSSLPVQSLFLFGIKSLSEDGVNRLTPFIQGNKLLRVLDLEGVNIETLPDEIGDLIHLRYLSLKKSNVSSLPETVSKLRNLQTLDVRWTRLVALSTAILNLQELRHLLMFKPSSPSGVIVPLGVGSSKNLQSFTGLYAGDGVAAEIGKLTQIRKLGIKDLTEEDVNEVCASIMKMKGLLSLSIDAKFTYPDTILPPIEPFSPPTLLQKLRLEGRLQQLPSWFSLMENLQKLRLGFSRLSEDPALVLQFLPNLKHLTLWHAYNGKIIGKEFCGVGGFPKLEVLVICSHVLEEWTELEQGALPCLKQLNMHNCLSLRMLPEGLQHLNKLRELKLMPLLDEHEEKLKPEGGEENYKIRQIPMVSFMTTSMVREHVEGLRAQQTA